MVEDEKGEQQWLHEALRKHEVRYCEFGVSSGAALSFDVAVLEAPSRGQLASGG